MAQVTIAVNANARDATSRQTIEPTAKYIPEPVTLISCFLCGGFRESVTHNETDIKAFLLATHSPKPTLQIRRRGEYLLDAAIRKLPLFEKQSATSGTPGGRALSPLKLVVFANSTLSNTLVSGKLRSWQTNGIAKAQLATHILPAARLRGL